MKKLLLFLTIVVFSHTNAFSQGCLPEGITFTTQAQIDSFQINYPGCSVIEGDMFIWQSNITNLYGLNILTSIGGSLSFVQNSILENVNGLENLTSIGGSLSFTKNDILENFNGLENLTSVGGNLTIGLLGQHFNGGNPSLTNLTGLNNLSSVGGYLCIEGNQSLTNIIGLESITSSVSGLSIRYNVALPNLIGLEGLTSISGSDGNLYINHNDALINLTGLDNVTSIGGELDISGNLALSSLTGLESLTSIGWRLSIYDNETLSDCDVQSICDFLATPNIPISIQDNATGCNSLQEVEAACGIVVVQSRVAESSMVIYPNPAFDYITIESSAIPAKNQLFILNLSGQKMLQQTITEPVEQVDICRLPSGIYFVKVIGETTVQTGKIIKQ